MSLRIGQEIYAALTADALPGGAEARVFPVLAPAGALALPFVTYQCKALAGSYTKDGDVVDRGTVTVSCIAKTYGEAVELAVAVRKRLTGCPGAGVEAQLSGSSEGYALDADAYTVDLDFSVASEPDV